MYINKVFLYGNLTRDPELRALPSGTQVASFGLATNRVYRDKDGNRQEDTTFHNITMFGKQAELAAQYLKKGRPVFVDGRLRTSSWEKDGQKQSRTEIVVENFQFGPSSGEASGRSFAGDESAEPSKPAAASASKGKVEYPEDDINPEDIPF